MTTIATARRAAAAEINKANARAAYDAATARMRDQIQALQAALDRGLGHPEVVNFGHVGDVELWASKLGDALDSINHTGEYAA